MNWTDNNTSGERGNKMVIFQSNRKFSEFQYTGNEESMNREIASNSKLFFGEETWKR